MSFSAYWVTGSSLVKTWRCALPCCPSVTSSEVICGACTWDVHDLQLVCACYAVACNDLASRHTETDILNPCNAIQADPAAAFQQFQEAALQGDAYAVFNLGYMHMKGIGTQPNATTAQQNFEIAAKHGIPAAYNGLGVLHFEGHAGSTIDYSAARQAFMNGAALGDPDSMFNLATIYAGQPHAASHVHAQPHHRLGSAAFLLASCAGLQHTPCTSLC